MAVGTAPALFTLTRTSAPSRRTSMLTFVSGSEWVRALSIRFASARPSQLSSPRVKAPLVAVSATR